MRGAGRLLAASAILTAALCGAAAAAPADRAAWLERVERGRQDYRAFIEKASLSRPPAAGLRNPDHEAAPSDPTLRDGDILVSVHAEDAARVERVSAVFKRLNVADVGTAAEAAVPKPRSSSPPPSPRESTPSRMG